MGLLDSAGPFAGGGLLGLSPQAMGVALMAQSQPTRMPHSFFGDIGNAAMNAQEVQGRAYQNALQQMQLPFLAQRYQLMQDAINGTGAFGGGPGQPPGGAIAPQDAAQAALSQGGGPTVQNAQTMNAIMANGGNGGGGGTLSGNPMRDAILADALGPTASKIIANRYGAPINVRPGGAVFDPVTGQVRYQQPQLPQGVLYNPQNQSVSPIAGSNTQAATLAGIQQGAQQEREENVARFNYGLQYGSVPGGVATNAGGGGGGASGAPGTFAQSSALKDIPTDHGTVVPSARTNQVMGPGGDLIGKQNTESMTTEKNWAAVRPMIETARARLMVMSGAFQSLDTKGLTEGRAEISNNLRGIGLDGMANAVMSAKDTADVQKVLWTSMQDVMATLKTLNAGTGGRILASEFQAFMEHSFNPNMLGPALHSAVSQQLASLNQTGNMIDDYHGIGRQSGWRDANQFQSAYLRSNPIEKFVKDAEKSVPPFRGMASASRGAPKLADPLGIR